MAETGSKKLHKSQAARFRKTARELGCDESEERFDAALKKVAGTLPSKSKQPKKPPKE